MASATVLEPNIAHYQRVLAGLVDRAAAVAHKLADSVDAAATAAEVAPLAAAFERVTMIVRRTILLSVHLEKAAEKSANVRTAARMRINRDMSDTIAREGLPPAKAENLRVELDERLESFDLAPALDREIATRPLADIILDLNRDMGLARVPGTPPWPTAPFRPQTLG